MTLTMDDLEKKAKRVREVNVKIWQLDCERNILQQEIGIGYAELQVAEEAKKK